jgi:hypothetical protein
MGWILVHLWYVNIQIPKTAFTPLIKKCYENYFGCKVCDQDKSWAPNFCCVTCARLQTAWTKGSHCMPFAHGPCFSLLLLPDQYHWCSSIVQTRCSISYFTICDEASTSQCGVTSAKASKNMTLSDSESGVEDVGQANNNTDCDPTFAYL